jgi:hypothetical protein
VSSTITRPIGAHLVGSIPLHDAGAVFRLASETLGPHLRRIPDGETGERSLWIAWQGKLLSEHPALETEEPAPGQYAPFDRVHLKDGASADALAWRDGIGYAAAALDSYGTFKVLKREGVIPLDVQFQVSLPTPLATITQFVTTRDQAAVEPAYERQLLHELEVICAAIPHDQLAIQWDVAIEIGVWEGIGGMFTPWFAPMKDGIVERLARLATATPADVDLGFHFCYGDFAHEHFVQPNDLGNLVDLANRLIGAVSRPIEFVHVPVPRDRSDAEYFAALADLQLPDGCTLYLGLVHLSDGVDGTEQRIRAAQAVCGEFGVATECGFGRRPPDTVKALLEIHKATSRPLVD